MNFSPEIDVVDRLEKTSSQSVLLADHFTLLFQLPNLIFIHFHAEINFVSLKFVNRRNASDHNRIETGMEQISTISEIKPIRITPIGSKF